MLILLNLPKKAYLSTLPPLGHPEEYSPMHPGRGHSPRPGPQLCPGLPPGHGLCGADGGTRQHYQETEEIISL